MYTPLEEAKKEVWKRWNNVDLRRRIQAFVGEMPECMEQEPCTVLARHLTTPNFELLKFCELTQHVGAKAVCFEYKDDLFCTNNIDKVLTAKMRFLHGNGRNNGKITTFMKLFDLPGNDNIPLSRIQSSNGLNIVRLHHTLLNCHKLNIEIVTSTPLYEAWGKKPSAYYRKFLALFICHGILFENFLLDGSEGQFTRDIAWPAIRQVTNHFGLKPLIVRLLPEESEADPYWCWYPGHLEAEVRRLMAGGKTVENVCSNSQ